jgi:hypothetical protein
VAVSSGLITLAAAILVTITGALLLVIYDWRASVVLLAIQYVGVFLLVGVEWPVGMAVTRLVAGWMAGAVLGMAMLSLPEHRPEPVDEEAEPARRVRFTRRFQPAPGEAPSPLFHLLAAALVGLAIGAEAPDLVEWLPGLSPV